MPLKAGPLSLAAIVSLGVASGAAAAEVEVRRMPGQTAPAISGLRFPDDDVLDAEPGTPDDDDETQTYVTLVGTYPAKEWDLLWNQSIIRRDAGGGFRIRVPLQQGGIATTVKLIAVGPLGSTQKQSVDLRHPALQARSTARERTRRKNSLQTGLGVTSISFSESNNPDYSALVLTGKVTYTTPILDSQRWDLSASAYGTLLALNRSIPTTLRFLGLNLRAGYALSRPAEPWRLSIFGGIYYTTAISDDQAFGFRNLISPQLYPTIRRAFGRGREISAYFKFAPIADGFRILSFGNRELAGGLSYSSPLAGTHPVSFSLDASSLRFSMTGVSVSSRTLTLGASYGF